MPVAEVAGVRLDYDVIGESDAPVLLCIMGFTAQRVSWPDGFVEGLAAEGLRVVRFDNRDAGLSTWFDEFPVNVAEVLAALADGRTPEVPYTLSDMASDAAGLLDHLGVASAHVLGASMGGMIAQTMAIEHPGRCTSLVSVMSTTGEREFGAPTADAARALLTPLPEERTAYLDEAVSRARIWGSRRYFSETSTRERMEREYDRALHPAGAGRQFGAILASGSRADGLGAVGVPTLVIHGEDDTLIDPSGGRRTAELVPGAELLLVADMGHDLPEPLWPQLTEAVGRHCRSAER